MTSVLVRALCLCFFPIKVNSAVKMKRPFPYVTIPWYGNTGDHSHPVQPMLNFSYIVKICSIFWEQSIVFYPWLWPNISILL